MAEDYKQVGDCSLSDIAKKQKDAWDSGEFRHEEKEREKTEDGVHLPRRAARTWRKRSWE